MTFRTNYEAYDGHILVYKEPVSNTTDSGLVIPDSAKKKQEKYEVIHVGYGVERLEVGDFIFFKDASVYMGNNIIIKDHAVFLDEKMGIISVRKENIIAVERKSKRQKAPWETEGISTGAGL